MPVGKASRKKEGLINETQTSRGELEKELKPSQQSPSKGSLPKTTSIMAFIPLLILLLVSFGVYFNALFGDFVHDDRPQIIDNPWIRDIRNIPTIFSKNVWSFQPGHIASNYYRPLMHIVFMLNYHVFGLKPWGFHLVNILFHCGTSVLVFLIIRRFLTEQSVTTSLVYLSPPFIAAVLFASHPVHTEAVTWIAGLPDVSFTFFYLLSLYLYILFRDGAKRGYLLSILSFSVATLFKEPALTLPVMLIAYDYLVKKSDETIRAGIKRYIPYAVISGVYLLVRHYALRSFAPEEFYPGLSTYQLIINVFPLFREYLTSLLWPYDLNLWHTFHPLNSLIEATGMISIVVTVIFFIAAVAAYRKNKVVLFGLLLFVVPLLPVFYIKGIGGKPFAERYLYLPSVGFVLLLAIFLTLVREKLPRAGKSTTIVFMIIVGLYAVGTINRNNDWKDDFHLWSDTVKKSPDSADVRFGLANAYVFKGQVDMAIEQFQTALRLQPDFEEAYNNLGNVYQSKGQFDMAIEQYQTALRLQPDFAWAHTNLGNTYQSKGQIDMAIEQYQTAIRLTPDFAEAHYNLGNTYQSKGLFDMAIEQYQAAIRLKPDLAVAHNNLGNTYLSKGQVDMAIEQYQRALKLRPDYIEAHINLGAAYVKKGLKNEAIRELKAALEISPSLTAVRQALEVLTR